MFAGTTKERSIHDQKTPIIDTDGDMEALASLPTEVYTPPFLHQEQYDDIEEFLDDVSDWLSDEYGWCHFGFETETDDGGIIKCDTLPE